MINDVTVEIQYYLNTKSRTKCFTDIITYHDMPSDKALARALKFVSDKGGTVVQFSVTIDA